MDSFIFNAFKKRFLLGEVPSNDTWTFSVVNSKLADYQNIKSFRTSADFLKIGGEDKYNSVFTEVTPVNFYYKELPDLDESYASKKPMYITAENWTEFFEEYYDYVCDWDKETQTWVPRKFYETQTDLQHLFFDYQPTGEYTENGEPIVLNFAKYAEFDGFYWITTKEELAWCADRANGDIQGQKGTTFNNKIAIVLGDDIGTNDITEDTTIIRSCIGKYPERPFEGLLFGNGYAFQGIDLHCANDINGIVGTLGTGGKIHYCRVEGKCKITCEKKISITHLKNSANDIVVGMLCGRNYGEVFMCESNGSVEVNNFVPSVYCVQNKTEEGGSNKNPDSNIFYPNYMCINNPGNIIPYCGYFNEGVFASNSMYQTLTNMEPSGRKESVCSGCYGTLLVDTCNNCQGKGYTTDYDSTNQETYMIGCTKCGGVSDTKKGTTTEFHVGRGFSAHQCAICDGYGYLSGAMTENGEPTTWNKPTAWNLPASGEAGYNASAVSIECTACYGTMSELACACCSGTGSVNDPDNPGYEMNCTICNGRGISGHCPTCAGHDGIMYTVTPATTYSAYMLKQWAASRNNKLDNTGVATIVTNNLTVPELKNMLDSGAAAQGFITFYDYKQVAKTMELAGLAGEPDYSDAFLVSAKNPDDLTSTESKLIPLVTEDTIAVEYSGMNGYSDMNGSTTPLSNATQIFIDTATSAMDNSLLTKAIATSAQREELFKQGIGGSWGTKKVSDFSPPGQGDSIKDYEGAIYRWGCTAMPYSMFDQSMKLNSANRAAYYVSPLVGLNKANIGRCYVNEEFSSSGSFVGFFGGIAGKQAGGWIYDSTVNIHANENEKRDIFTASAEHAIDAGEGLIFQTRALDADQLTLSTSKEWDGDIAFIDPTVTDYTSYVYLRQNLKINNFDNSNVPSACNHITCKMRKGYTLPRTWWQKLLGKEGTKILGDTSCSDPMVPLTKGFNISLSGFSGASYISKTVIDFNVHSTVDMPGEADGAIYSANSAYYEAYKTVNVCSVGSDPTFNWADMETIRSNNAYFYVPSENITHTDYNKLNLSGDDVYKLSNMVYNTPYYIHVPAKADDAEKCAGFYHLDDEGNLKYDSDENAWSAWGKFKEAYSADPTIISATVLEHATVKQCYSAALVNYLDFKSVGDNVQWQRFSAEDGTIYYENTAPMWLNLWSFYDVIDTAFKVDYDRVNFLNHHYIARHHPKDYDYSVNRYATSLPTQFNLEITDKAGNTRVEQVTAQGIYIGKMRFREELPIEIHSLEGMQKTAQVVVDSVSDIMMCGAYYDDEHFKRTDYIIRIPELDSNDTLNFIDKCASSVNDKTGKISYTDKYTRDPKRSLNEICLRNDGIYGYLNTTTWDMQKTFSKYNTIFYYKYFEINYDDINDYSCTLYSIRNVGALAGSLIVGNKQYITGNQAFLNNNQGLLYKEPERNVAPYVYTNTYVSDNGNTGVIMRYVGAKKASLMQYPDWYVADGSTVYESNAISDKNGNKVYPFGGVISSNNHITIDGIYPQDNNGALGEVKVATTTDTISAGNELFTCFYDSSSVTGTPSGVFVTSSNLKITDGIAYITGQDAGLVGKYMINGIGITNDTKLPLYTLATGKDPVMALGVIATYTDSYVNSATSASVDTITKEYLHVTKLTDFNKQFTNFVTSSVNVDEVYSAISANYDRCNVAFPGNFPPSRDTCKCTYIDKNTVIYFDGGAVNQYYKGTLDAMEPQWRDYNLLNRYGALAAICEYNTCNISDKYIPTMNYTTDELNNMRPITLTSNRFAYHEHTIAGEHSMQYGPMKLGSHLNLTTHHVAGHRIFGIASPLIAELKPVAKAIPSVFQYNNGVMEGLNEAGLFRTGYVNQYVGMFTTDMGIRSSSADPWGWVTNDAIDIPGVQNFTIGNTGDSNIFWNHDTRAIANNLFDWTTTMVEPGNITVTGALYIDSMTQGPRKWWNGKSRSYHDPYELTGQTVSYTNEINTASRGKIKNALWSTTLVHSFKYKSDGEGTPNIGYGFTLNPIETITVPFNSFKDTLGNKYPAGIYGISDITRYKDINDTICHYDSASVRNGIYRPDYEQLQNPFNDLPNPWEIFARRKRRNRYPYFGSSIRLIRDDDDNFIGVPGYNNIRDGKYVNDCVPSYIMDVNNQPKIDVAITDAGYTPTYRPCKNIKPEGVYDLFEYTYDTIPGEPFTSFTKPISFEVHNNHLGYWTQNSINTGFPNDTITYSGTEAVKYTGNVFALGYTKIPDTIREEIVNSPYSYSVTSGISGADIQGLLVQDSVGNNVMYINMGLGDCYGLETWSYSALPSIIDNNGEAVSGSKGLLLEVN